MFIASLFAFSQFALMMSQEKNMEKTCSQIYKICLLKKGLLEM